MKFIKLITLTLLLLYRVDVFAQRGYEQEIYGSSGGDGGPFGWLALIIFVGLVIWGVITDRGFRLGVLAYFAYIGSLIFIFKIFGKEAGITACIISIVFMWIRDPSRTQANDSNNLNSSNNLYEKQKLDSSNTEEKYKTLPKSSFDNAKYPAHYSDGLKSADYNPTSQPKKIKLNVSDEPIKLFDGNIRCKCGYQDLHSNFLSSDAGNLFRKCPKCESHSQILSSSNYLGAHKCPGCGHTGDSDAFFASSAGERFLKCPKCNNHFEN